MILSKISFQQIIAWLKKNQPEFESTDTMEKPLDLEL